MGRISLRAILMPRRFLRFLLCLLFVLGTGVSCGKLKKRVPPALKAGAVPEIVDEPAEGSPGALPVPLDPAVPELTVNKSAQVAILGYHDFVKGKASKPMQINIDRFREQMQALKDARMAVIPMKDFLAWRRGEKDIPDPCVVITMDDGWKSVYTLALPVMKEFGYPFTIFLYKNFLNGGPRSRSLSTAEIQEIMAAGGEVGSHSVSHPYKGKIDAMFRRSAGDGGTFLRVEMKDSKQFFEDLLAVKVTTYAYPGGYFSEREVEIGKEAGYEAMFTVNPAKVTWDTPATAIGRFIIIGTDLKDANFKRAISSRGTSEGELARQLLGGDGDTEPLVTTKPLPNATVASRRPVIEVDVSKLEGIDPASIVMKIAGFGPVPAQYDDAEKKISYRVSEMLRTNECQVFVTFKRKSEPKPEIVSWRFFLDLVAHYLPEPPAKLEKTTPLEEAVLSPPPAEESQPEPPPEAAPAPVTELKRATKPKPKRR